MRAHAARPILQCVPAVYCAAMPHGTYQRMQQTQSSSSSDNYHSAIIHPPAPLVIAISIHCRSRSSSISWDIIPFARMPPNETNECPSRTPPAGRLGNGRSITGARCHPSAYQDFPVLLLLLLLLLLSAPFSGRWLIDV